MSYRTYSYFKDPQPCFNYCQLKSMKMSKIMTRYTIMNVLPYFKQETSYSWMFARQIEKASS